MNPEGSIIDLGFYGKLPTYGDFIQKRLPTDFINPWHEWLQQGMVACRERDPQGWMTYYLNCPAWSFVLAGGVCGQQPIAGVTIPSVDRVGRYFNFTLASILPEEIVPAAFANTHGEWLEGLENLALSILEEEMDQDAIERAINGAASELHWETPPYRLFSMGSEHLKVVASEPSAVRDMLPEITHQLIGKDHAKYGLWWHQGSSQVSAQLVCCANMPAGDVYLGLMMDDDLLTTTELEGQSQPAEVNYMDELLSD
jgi:type VI secretion system protein ImpM